MAVSRATLYSKSNLGVGYLNVHLKALERLARLLGLDAPLRTELSRSVPAGLAEVVISDAQMAERLRLAADDFDERAKAEA